MIGQVKTDRNRDPDRERDKEETQPPYQHPSLSVSLSFKISFLGPLDHDYQDPIFHILFSNLYFISAHRERERERQSGNQTRTLVIDVILVDAQVGEQFTRTTIPFARFHYCWGLLLQNLVFDL